MLSKEGYASLGNIYDTALNLGAWRKALDAVSMALNAKASALLIREIDSKSRDRQMLSSNYLAFSRSPAGLYYGLRFSRLQDPDWAFLSKQETLLPVPDFETGLEPQELDRRGDYKYLRKKLGLGRRLGVRLNGDRVWFDAISLAFDKNYRAIPQNAFDQAKYLLPHLTKALEIGRAFGELRTRYAAVLTSLDRVQIGMAVALPSGELLIENAETRRMLSMQDGLSKSASGHLKCNSAEQSSEIKAAIFRASRTAGGEETLCEHLIAVQRPSLKPPFLIEVAPLKDSQAELDEDLEGALVTIIDPERVPFLKMDRFNMMYGLSDAEATVCGYILQGQSIDEIAERRNTSPITVKNQLAAIFSKTQVKRQSELIRLLLKVLPPIE